MQWLTDKYILSVIIATGCSIIGIIWRLVYTIINQALEKRDDRIDNLIKTFEKFEKDIKEKFDSLERHKQKDSEHFLKNLEQIITKLPKK